MKPVFPILFLGIVALAHAQSTDESTVASSVESLRLAMINADQPSLESLTSEALSYGHSSGTIEDKAAYMDAIMSGRNDFKKIEQTSQTIKITGNLAIVRHKFTAEMTVNGTAATPNIGVLQVWQKEKDKWKLIARQAYKL